MSQGYTTSMSKGRTAPKHALRDEEYTRKEQARGRLKNVDITKTKYNVILRDMGGKSLEQTFNETFAEDVEKHNLHQVDVGHPERQIKNYFEKIKKDYDNAKDKRKALKTDYEYVIQFGGTATGGSPAESVDMLKLVYDILASQEQAGNWHINYAAIHVDETSPHMHINMTPIARGYKKGMPARPALNKATKQWKESIQNAYVDRNFAYQHLLDFVKNGVMVKALRDRGYEHLVMNNERAHSTVEEYKQKCSLQAENQDLQSQINTKSKDLATCINEIANSNETLAGIQEDCRIQQGELDGLNANIRTQKEVLDAKKAKKFNLIEKSQSTQSKLNGMSKKSPKYRMFSTYLPSNQNQKLKSLEEEYQSLMQSKQSEIGCAISWDLKEK